MGRIKDWMMDIQEREIDRLLNENPEMSAEEAHIIVCDDPYHLYQPFKWRTGYGAASLLDKRGSKKRQGNN
tara:strand:- start:271 stop:483 length:213 start_codon:yes stop_codon:yes gene_type:complete